MKTKRSETNVREVLTLKRVPPKPQPEIDEFADWIEIDSRMNASIQNSVTVAFSKPNQVGTSPTKIRIGIDIINRMGWYRGDRISVYVNPTNNYQWMLFKTSNGYLLGGNPEQTTILELTFSWRKQGFISGRAKEVRNLDIRKDRIIFDVVHEGNS